MAQHFQQALLDQLHPFFRLRFIEGSRKQASPNEAGMPDEVVVTHPHHPLRGRSFRSTRK